MNINDIYLVKEIFRLNYIILPPGGGGSTALFSC